MKTFEEAARIVRESDGDDKCCFVSDSAINKDVAIFIANLTIKAMESMLQAKDLNNPTTEEATSAMKMLKALFTACFAGGVRVGVEMEKP